jgi:hypothetical protein
MRRFATSSAAPRRAVTSCITAAMMAGALLAPCPPVLAIDCATQLDECLYDCAILCGSDGQCLERCDTRCEIQWMHCTGTLPMTVPQPAPIDLLTPERPTS